MERFTSRFNRVVAVGAWILVAAATVTYAVAHHGLPQPLWLLPAALVALGAWAWLWRPAVEVDDEGVTLVNPLRTVRVPWSALIQVDTRFALALRTPHGTYSAWAAPAPGRTGIALAQRRDARDRASARVPDVGPTPRPGDLVTTESGAAASLVREHWHELREAGRIDTGVADQATVTVRIHWWIDTVELLLVAGCCVAVALPK